MQPLASKASAQDGAEAENVQNSQPVRVVRAFIADDNKQHFRYDGLYKVSVISCGKVAHIDTLLTTDSLSVLKRNSRTVSALRF